MDEAMKAAAVALATEHYCERFKAGPEKKIVRLNTKYNWQLFLPNAQTAIAAFLKAWEPDEAVLLESIQRVCCGLPSEDWREGLCAAPKCDCYRKHGLRIVPDAVKAAARAEAERMERGG